MTVVVHSGLAGSFDAPVVVGHVPRVTNREQPEGLTELIVEHVS